MGNLQTIPLSLPFADTLAEEILRKWGDDPLILSSITLLLPSRRAARAMRSAFLRVTDGKPLLLPAMRGLGDVEEEELLPLPFTGEAGLLGERSELREPGEGPLPDPPPQAGEGILSTISPIRRQLLLAGMIQRWNSDISREQAMRLAYELAAFLDEAQRYELPLENLKHIVPEELSEHWQLTLGFFDILAKDWPLTLKQLGLMDPVARRNQLLDRQADAWRNTPPAYPVIAAGTTGSTPATLRLLKVIMQLPQGQIVLPALDREMRRETWEKLGESHPQYALKQLLEGLGVERSEIAEAVGPASERERLLAAIMHPAGVEQPQVMPEMLYGLFRLDAATPRQEAEAIALGLREALETPGRTAALITTDRQLAFRVASLMRRWDIAIDDSAGLNLADTPPVVFLRLIAAMAAEHFAPVPLLAALKHPLATGSIEAGAFRHRVRELEIAALRGLRPQGGIAGLRAAMEMKGTATKELLEFLKLLEEMTEKFYACFAGEKLSPAALLAAHVACAERLAGGAENLWGSDAGGQALAWLDTLEGVLEGAPPLFPQEYPEWFETLWLGKKFRPAYGQHPRLAILSPMEARLQRFDRVILSGMNEGSWPSTRVSPWMNHAMRKDFGLPSGEFFTGLSARDFVEACSAPEVILTRAEKSGGKPTIPSPWLLRLEALGLKPEAKPWLAWAEALHEPGAEERLAPPRFAPPLAVRPKKFWVTDVEKWMRDPYHIYAKKILGLEKLEDLDQDPDAADFGTLLHGIFERFVKEVYCHPERAKRVEGSHVTGGDPSTTGVSAYAKASADKLPSAQDDKGLSLLLSIGEEAFRAYEALPAARSLWWPRFERIAAWFVDTEGQRREEIAGILTEQRGEVTFGDIILGAKSDRIESLKDGSVRIVDYKTGTVPEKGEVMQGLACQLTLTALMAERDGAQVSALEYWKLSARGAEIVQASVNNRKDVMPQLMGGVRDGFPHLLAAFAEEMTPYLACPRGEKVPYNDYEHLERVREWRAQGEQE